MALDIVSFVLILTLFAVASVMIIFIGYKVRSSKVLDVLGFKRFRFGIINEAGTMKWINRISNDLIIHGKVILFKFKDGFYKVEEEKLFFMGNMPASIYRFANPVALNIMNKPDSQIAVYDEEHKTMVTVNLSAQELKDAIQAKIVHDLNRAAGFTRLEFVSIIIGALGLVILCFNLYQIYGINQEIGALINQLNQILANLPKTSPSVPTA